MNKHTAKKPLGFTWKGFTLIELLVVISIIALLAAILFPVFGRVRENARRSSCQTRLKQIALATLQYVDDNDNRYPGQYWSYVPGGQVRWMERIDPYLKSKALMFCPSETVLTDFTYVSIPNTSYCYNNYYLGDNGNASTSGGVLLSEILDPVNTVMFSERTNAPLSSTTRYICRVGVGSSNAPTDPHFEGANAAFVDGHVKWFKEPGVLTKDITYWDLK